GGLPVGSFTQIPRGGVLGAGGGHAATTRPADIGRRGAYHAVRAGEPRRAAIWPIGRVSANIAGARGVHGGPPMKAVAALLLGLFALGARADEPDPRAEMARALEAQADLVPAPPALPQQAAVHAAAKGAIGAARVSAIRAAVHAAVSEVARAAAATLPPTAAPAAQAATERAHGRGPAQPPTRRQH